MLRLLYSNMKCPPKLIQAKTRRRNTMDSLYFTELVERSENTTQQESGECMCKCRSWKVAFFATKICNAEWMRQGGTGNRVHIHR
jgi:hypothetical protein